MREYFTNRLNRIIIDYMLRENYFDSSKIFIEETGMNVCLNYHQCAIYYLGLR